MTAATVAALRTPLRPTQALVAGSFALVAGASCLPAVERSPFGLVQAAVAGLLVWLAALDLEYRLVPNRIVLPAAVLVLGAVAVFEPARLREHALAAAGASAFLFVAARMRSGGLGMGDVKLALLLGATLGASVLTGLMVGFGLVGLTGLALVAREGRVALKRQLPLVPFLALGAIAALILG